MYCNSKHSVTWYGSTGEKLSTYKNLTIVTGQMDNVDTVYCHGLDNDEEAYFLDEEAYFLDHIRVYTFGEIR